MKYVGETSDGLDLVHKLASLGGLIKITRIEKDGWNEWSGQDYMITVKATAPDGKVWKQNKRKNMLFQFTTNSTWIEPADEEDANATEEELIRELVEFSCL